MNGNLDLGIIIPLKWIWWVAVESKLLTFHSQILTTLPFYYHKNVYTLWTSVYRNCNIQWVSASGTSLPITLPLIKLCNYFFPGCKRDPIAWKKLKERWEHMGKYYVPNPFHILWCSLSSPYWVIQWILASQPEAHDPVDYPENPSVYDQATFRPVFDPFNMDMTISCRSNNARARQSSGWAWQKTLIEPRHGKVKHGSFL